MKYSTEIVVKRQVSFAVPFEFEVPEALSDEEVWARINAEAARIRPLAEADFEGMALAAMPNVGTGVFVRPRSFYSEKR